jgi:hypothetical protein
MAKDLFLNYDLDGYQWGSERSGPLAELMSCTLAPGCFWEHYLQRAAINDIDPERAKTGFIVLHETMVKSWNGTASQYEEYLQFCN